jgi:hypothetical protein
MRRYRQRRKRSLPSAKTVAKQLRRTEREAALAAARLRAARALGAALYGVLYIDPPWDFLVYSRATGMDRHAANHYPGDVARRAVRLQAAGGQGLRAVSMGSVQPARQRGRSDRHWGFTLKTGHGNGWNSGGVGWGKPDLGTGLIVRGRPRS